MPSVARSPLALALAAAAAIALTSCGGGSDAKLLPGNTAQEISENLDSVQRLVDEEECAAAEDEALEVSSQVEALEGIDPKLQQVLEQGAARLNEVVDTCVPEETVEETIPEPAETTEEEPQEKEKKPKKEPEETLPEEEESEAPAEEALPPQAKGKAKGHEEEPPVEEEVEEPSGGIGPGSAAEGE
jgi:hypothetical protein